MDSYYPDGCVHDNVVFFEEVSMAQQKENKNSPYQIGKSYLIRTVTHYYIGVLKTIYDGELLLKDASWIADTGRYYNALKDGELNEVEPIIGDLIIGRGGIIDCVEWRHPLPRDQK